MLRANDLHLLPIVYIMHVRVVVIISMNLLGLRYKRFCGALFKPAALSAITSLQMIVGGLLKWAMFSTNNGDFFINGAVTDF